MTWSIDTYTLELERRIDSTPADDRYIERWRLLAVPTTTDRAAPTYESSWAGVEVIREISSHGSSLTQQQAFGRLLGEIAP
jgi:hypothetical protein